MTRADLIEEVSKVAGTTLKQAEVIVEAVFNSIVHALRSSDKVEIRGFGRFDTRLRAARVGHNPATGEAIEVPAKRIPFFKPGKELKSIVNAGEAIAPPPIE
jgi:integration host factor subunit beta